MVEDLFRFMLVRGVTNPDRSDGATKSDTIILVSSHVNDKGDLEVNLENLKKQGSQEEEFQQLSETYKHSEEYIDDLTDFPLKLSGFQITLSNHNGALSRQEFQAYAETTILLNEQIVGAPGDMIEGSEYKILRTRFIDSLLALSVVPDEALRHRDELVRLLKLCYLVELAYSERWPFNEKFDFRGIMARFVVALPSTIFPIPQTETQAGQMAEDSENTAVVASVENEVLRQAREELEALMSRRDAVSGKDGYLTKSAVKILSQTTQNILSTLGFSLAAVDPVKAMAAIEGKIARPSRKKGTEARVARGVIVGNYVFQTSGLASSSQHSERQSVIKRIKHQRLLENAEVEPSSSKFYYSGMADLNIVRQELVDYELGDFAHVENVLAGEKRERKHRRLNRKEEEFFERAEIKSETESDVQKTSRSEIKLETEKVLAKEYHVEGSVTASSHGTVYDVTATASGGLSGQTSSTSRQAANFAQDVVQKAVERYTEHTLTEERIKTITEIEETNTHIVDNAHPNAKHIRGVYRWLNKIYSAQVYNYGMRHMFDFIIPEPAAFYIDSLTSDSLSSINIPIEPDFDDIEDEAEWMKLALLYGAVGVKPRPKIRTIVWNKSEGTQSTANIVRWTPFSGPKWGVAKVEPAELNTSWS